MRTLSESLIWMLASRGSRRSFHQRPQRMMRAARPWNPLRGLFRLFWGLFWTVVGLGIAFSPEFRGMFVQFWVGFAHLMASLARGLASIFQ